MSDAAQLKVLQEIRDDIRRLIAAVERNAADATPRVSEADRATLATLLPIIVAAVGARAFTMRELYAHAEVGDVAPVRALRTALNGWSAKKLGKLFGRAADCEFEGCSITAVEDTRSGVCWAIRARVSSPQKVATFAAIRRRRI